MTILLNRNYYGLASGNVVSLTTPVEAALVAQGLAATSAAALTTGALTNNTPSGRVAFAAAATSVVVTNSLVDANTKIVAYINQAAADGTFTFVARIVPAAGSFTIFANAGATAATVVDWFIPTIVGEVQLIA